MSDHADGTNSGVSRRGLLRAAGIGAGAGLIGVAGTAGRATASYCPRPPEYWANTDWPETDRVDDPFVLVDPDDERSRAVWRLFLASDQRGDKGAVMARHLLAAHLNFQLRPTDDGDCVDKPLSAYGGWTVRELRAEARKWLSASNWPDEQTGWIVDGVDGAPLKDALVAFNQGRIAGLDCMCMDTDRDDGSPNAETDHLDGFEGFPASDGERSDGIEGAQQTERERSDGSEACSGPRSTADEPCPLPRL